MTNSGKTYTIQGTKQNPGLFPLIVNTVITALQQKTESSSATSFYAFEKSSKKQSGNQFHFIACGFIIS
jgi:hypothetical protein